MITFSGTYLVLIALHKLESASSSENSLHISNNENFEHPTQPESVVDSRSNPDFLLPSDLDLAIPEVVRDSLPDPDIFLSSFLERFSDSSGHLDSLLKKQPLSFPSLDGSPIFSSEQEDNQPQAEERSLSVITTPLTWILNILWFLFVIIFSKKTFIFGMILLGIGALLSVFNKTVRNGLAETFNTWGALEVSDAQQILSIGTQASAADVWNYTEIFAPADTIQGQLQDISNQTMRAIQDSSTALSDTLPVNSTSTFYYFNITSLSSSTSSLVNSSSGSSATANSPSSPNTTSLNTSSSTIGEDSVALSQANEKDLQTMQPATDTKEIEGDLDSSNVQPQSSSTHPSTGHGYPGYTGVPSGYPGVGYHYHQGYHGAGGQQVNGGYMGANQAPYYRDF